GASDGAWQERLLNTRYACPRCQTSIGEIEPRTFSFSSPYGACPTCHGLGAVDHGDTPAAVTSGEGGDSEYDACPACKGSRLRAEARACRLGGFAIHEITALSIT